MKKIIFITTIIFIFIAVKIFAMPPLGCHLIKKNIKILNLAQYSDYSFFGLSRYRCTHAACIKGAQFRLFKIGFKDIFENNSYIDRVTVIVVKNDYLDSIGVEKFMQNINEKLENFPKFYECPNTCLKDLFSDSNINISNIDIDTSECISCKNFLLGCANIKEEYIEYLIEKISDGNVVLHKSKQITKYKYFKKDKIELFNN